MWGKRRKRKVRRKRGRNGGGREVGNSASSTRGLWQWSKESGRRRRDGGKEEDNTRVRFLKNSTSGQHNNWAHTGHAVCTPVGGPRPLCWVPEPGRNSG